MFTNIADYGAPPCIYMKHLCLVFFPGVDGARPQVLPARPQRVLEPLGLEPGGQSDDRLPDRITYIFMVV